LRKPRLITRQADQVVQQWIAARNDIQELLRPTGQLSAGVAMQVLQKKGTLKLNVRDMF